MKTLPIAIAHAYPMVGKSQVIDEIPRISVRQTSEANTGSRCSGPAATSDLLDVGNITTTK